MAGGHAVHGRAQRRRGGPGRHRAPREPRTAYAWLGAGAITLGVGAALVSGAGVAHAEDTDGASAATSSASSADSASATGSASATKDSAASGATTKGPVANGTATGTPATEDASEASGRPTAGAAAQSAEDASATSSATSSAASTPVAVTSEMKVAARTVHGKPSTKVDASGTTNASPAAAQTATAQTATAQTATAEQRDTVSDRGPKAEAAQSIPRASPAVVAVGAPATTAVVVSPPPAVFPDLPPFPGNPIHDFAAQAANIVNTLLLPNPRILPGSPLHLLAIEVVRHVEIALGLPVIGTVLAPTPDPLTGTLPRSSGIGTPSPTDVVTTPFGDIGKWLLEPNRQIATYGNQRLDGRTLLEPVNVVIVDPVASTPADAAQRLNVWMTAAGFPAMAIHTTGFGGVIDGITYGQQPSGVLDAFSNNFFLLPDDHARAFGPDPLETAAGYVWTIAVSREQLGFNGLLLTHVYVSYNAARNELAEGLVRSGATLVGAVPLSNAYDTATYTTGDNDGYALVVQLN